MNYYKNDPVLLKIFFNTILKPKTAKNDGEYAFLDEYYKTEFFNFEKFGGYKYNLLTQVDKEYFIKTHSAILSQIVSICGLIETSKGKIDFQLINIEDEESVIKEFINIVNDYFDYNVLWIHYGGLSFDCPLILRKAIKYGIEIKQCNFLNLAKFKLMPHYDMSAILSNWGVKTVDFKTACQELNIDYKEFKGDVSNLSDKEIKNIGINKTKASYEMYQKMKKVYN